jgi:uncharacterized protein DUF4079
MDYLKLLHGTYNTLMMALFIRQGWLGFTIRRARRGGMPLPLMAVRRHRQRGPILAAMAFVGFLAGATLSYVDNGHILRYPVHFAGGATLMLAIGATYLVSRQIKGGASRWRTVHFGIGIAILILYPLQVLLGLGVLL